MVVNTLCNSNQALALALREPQPHITSFWGVWFMQSAQMAPDGLTVALERTQVTVEYEEKKKSQELVHCPGQNAAVLCKKVSL